MDENGIGSAVKQIAELVTAKCAAMAKPVVVTVPERAGVYLLAKPDGTFEQKLAEPQWHAEILATPAELRAFALRWLIPEHACIYLADGGLTAVYDQDDRRNAAACPLLFTEQWKWIEASASKWMSQAEFVRALRITLRGVCADTLLSTIRAIRWNVGDQGDSKVEHGRQSIGRSLLAEVQGASAVPEDVSLNVQVYENFNKNTSVRAAVEIDPEHQTFRLTPFPGELRMALDDTHASIIGLFDTDDDESKLPPIFKGRP